MKRTLWLVAAMAELLLCSACATPPMQSQAAVTLAAGSLYSVEDGKGSFGVAKILVVEEQAVHVRLYKNRFDTRPKLVEPSTLGLGNIHDPGGFGIGHLPLTRDAFLAWKPELVQSGTVSESELEGYREWKEAHGGVFGK